MLELGKLFRQWESSEVYRAPSSDGKGKFILSLFGDILPSGSFFFSLVEGCCERRDCPAPGGGGGVKPNVENQQRCRTEICYTEMVCT